MGEFRERLVLILVAAAGATSGLAVVILACMDRVPPALFEHVALECLAYLLGYRQGRNGGKNGG